MSGIKGNVLGDQGKHDEAIALFDRVLAKEPGNAEVLNRKGCALERLGMHADSLDALRALSRKPANIGIMENICEVLI